MVQPGYPGQVSGLRPARLKVGIISAGRVGTALGVALERAEHIVVACSAVSAASVGRAERRLPDTLIRPVDKVAADSELLILAVPDSELTTLVTGLAATGSVKAGTIVVHTSGANGIAILAPLTELGCVPLAIHPAMTFTGGEEDIARLSETCFGITAADEIGYAVAQSLVLEIGGEPFRVREDARALYHAALAHGSNHLVTVVADALAALRSALWGAELLGQETVGDAPGGIAERVLAPLARSSSEVCSMPCCCAHTGATSLSSTTSADTNGRWSPMAQAWPTSEICLSEASRFAGLMFLPPAVMMSSFFRSMILT